MFFYLIILAIIIFFLLYQDYKQEIKNHYLSYSDLYHYFKTGDIILFSCRRSGLAGTSDFLRNLLISQYSHVGLIIRHGNKRYVLECCDKNTCADDISYHFNKEFGGIRITEMTKLLKSYVEEYDGFFAVRHIQEEIELGKVLQNLKYLEPDKVIFHDKMELTLLAFMDILISHNVATKLLNKQMMHNFHQMMHQMMCGELVHRILHMCNVLKYYPSKIFWPFLFEKPEFHDLCLIPYGDLIPFHF